MLHQAPLPKVHAFASGLHGARHDLDRLLVDAAAAVAAPDEARVAEDHAVDVGGLGIVGGAAPPAEVEGILLAAAELAEVPPDEVGVGAGDGSSLLVGMVAHVLVVALEDAHGRDGEVDGDEQPLHGGHLHVEDVLHARPSR